MAYTTPRTWADETIVNADDLNTEIRDNVSALYAMAEVPFRNRIINGALAIDQRNSGSSQTITSGAALAYTVDRFYAYCTGANVTSQRVAGTVPFQYNYRFTGAASNTLVGFGTRLEAADTFYMAGTTATLSAYIASSSLTTISWTAYYANTTDTFGTIASPTRTQIATGTFSLSSTLAQKSVQISIPDAATTGIEIVFTSGALLGTQTLTFAGIQFVGESVITPFEFTPFSVELARCQRYYQRFVASTVYGRFAVGQSYSGTGHFWLLHFPTTMRIAPSSIDTTGLVASNFAITTNSGGTQALNTLPVLAATANTPNSAYIEGTTAAGGTTGAATMLIANNLATAFLGFSAEL
jgi:hypothetical protein